VQTSYEALCPTKLRNIQGIICGEKRAWFGTETFYRGRDGKRKEKEEKIGAARYFLDTIWTRRKGSSGGAVAGALQDAEVGAPWTYGFAVLVGHDPGDLMQMRQIVGGPGGEEL
jgi:hypothetical protein